MRQLAAGQPGDEAFGESPAVADHRIVVLVERCAEPAAVVSDGLLDRGREVCRGRSRAPQRDDREPVAQQFQPPQTRPIPDAPRPHVVLPEVLVPDLVRDERLELGRVEQVECRFRDQDDESTVEPHERPGDVDDLDDVHGLTPVDLEHAPQDGKLPPLGGIQVGDLALGRQVRQHQRPLSLGQGSRTDGIEPLVDARYAVSREEGQRGVDGGAPRPGSGRHREQQAGRDRDDLHDRDPRPRRPAIPAATLVRHAPTLGAGRTGSPLADLVSGGGESQQIVGGNAAAVRSATAS